VLPIFQDIFIPRKCRDFMLPTARHSDYFIKLHTPPVGTTRFRYSYNQAQNELKTCYNQLLGIESYRQSSDLPGSALLPSLLKRTKFIKLNKLLDHPQNPLRIRVPFRIISRTHVRSKYLLYTQYGHIPHKSGRCRLRSIVANQL
jgi:hypothetical protein